MEKFTGLLKFAILNFGPLIVFYFINRLFDFKIAVICSMAFVALEFSYLKITKKDISGFFLFSSLLVLVFGVADLVLKEAFFFKLEAGIINLISAGYFAISLFRSKSIVEEVAIQKGQASMDKKNQEDQTFFFKIITAVWVVYFVMKAAAFTWMNFTTEMQYGLIYRMTLGPLSFWVLLGLSYGLGPTLWRGLEGGKFMPSQRQAQRTESQS